MHLAIIPDGNRTRAKENGLLPQQWHKKWSERIQQAIRYLFHKEEITAVTVWWLSSENATKRTEQELKYLYKLFHDAPESLVAFLREEQINFNRAGDPRWLPDDLVEYLDQRKKELSFSTGRTLTVCLNYGWKEEIIRWIQRCHDAWIRQIDDSTLSAHMDFAGIPPVDLIIRTKGDLSRRLSGFMLWRCGYAELYFSPKKCPDLDETEIDGAIERYNSIKSWRNFGK